MQTRFHLLLLGIALFFSCSKNQPELPPPNIVWITSEDNSVHYLKMFDENGVTTPSIEALAKGGITYHNAFSNAPVCSVARSTLISGTYAPRTGVQFHRKIAKVPLPDSLKMFPAYLKEAGYYTANNSKEDYNFIKDAGVWDESSSEASYHKRSEGQPFFYVRNFATSHESRLHFTRAQMDSVKTSNDPAAFRGFPNHPDTEIFQYTNAYYRDKIQQMDRQVGEVVAQLEEDGLLDNTFIFYFGDHGGVLPGSKGYVYETGLHVPLVVYVPSAYHQSTGVQPGSAIHGFVSFIDFGPTVLNLAGISIPEQMDGRPFLGPGINPEEVKNRDLTYSYADRFDEKYDMVRAVRKGDLKYIRNYQPFNFDGLMNNYRYRMLGYQEWDSLYRVGELDPIQAAFFMSKPAEMLYNLSRDPYETTNLVEDAEYASQLKDMRLQLDQWIKGMPDLSFFPEHVLIERAFDNPVAFGQDHKQQIIKYIETSNLALETFVTARPQLEKSLTSSDPWERYWALIVCSSFGDQAQQLLPQIKQATDDPEPLNRVRAAEYLGLTRLEDPVPTILEALYTSTKPAEALLILNTVVLLESYNYGYEFAIDTEALQSPVIESEEVQRRLLFLVGTRESQK